MIYLIVFACSFTSCAISEYLTGRQHVARFLFSGFAVLLPSVLNGIRDFSIGTDVLVYGNAVFHAGVMNRSFGGFLASCDMIGMSERGYALLNWIIAKVTSDVHFFYFVLGLLTNGLAFIAIKKYTGHLNVAIAWLTYLLVFFPTTMNMLRQSLAIVLVLFIPYCLSRGKVLRSFIILAVASTVHQSALFAIVLYLYYAAAATIERRDASSGHMFWIPSMSLVFLAVVAMVPSFIQIANDLGLLSDKYANYASGVLAGASITNGILVRFPFLLLAGWMLLSKKRGNGPLTDTYLMCILAEGVLLPLQLLSMAAFRISLYFGIFKVISYPAIIKRLGIPKEISYLFYIAFVIFYFVYQTIISGSGEVYPFVISPDFL